MRLRRKGEDTSDESSSWFGRGRGPTGGGTQPDSTTERRADESSSWIGRARAKYGLGVLLVVAGVALFLFPEPVTSTAGVVLIGVGALAWLAGWLR